MRRPTLRQFRMAALVVCAAWGATPPASGQSGGVHPISGRQFALPMSVEGAPWLERRERVDEEEPDLALRLLRVAKGSSVADIGAGSGYMTVRLAKIVGPMGRVYANDIQPAMLQLLQQNVARAKLANVTPVLGTFDDPKLPPASVDLVIMVDVYHEFSQPQRMLQRIGEALKPGGRLVLFEYSMAPRGELTARQRWVFDTIIAKSAMHGLPGFVQIGLDFRSAELPHGHARDSRGFEHYLAVAHHRNGGVQFMAAAGKVAQLLGGPGPAGRLAE